MLTRRNGKSCPELLKSLANQARLALLLQLMPGRPGIIIVVDHSSSVTYLSRGVSLILRTPRQGFSPQISFPLAPLWPLLAGVNLPACWINSNFY